MDYFSKVSNFSNYNYYDFNVTYFILKINTQNITFGGCLPAIWIAFVQFPGRNPWRLIHWNILFFIPLIIIVNWETKMYLYLISVFYVE